jgi:hypothetical protein
VDLPDPAGAECGRVVAAPAAELAVEAVEGDRVELGEPQLAEGRLELGLDDGPVVVESGGGERLAAVLPPGEVHVQQLPDRAGAGAAMAAVGDLGTEPGLQPLGLALALDLSGDLALAAGDGVNAGVDDHLIAAAAGPDRHAYSLGRCGILENR